MKIKLHKKIKSKKGLLLAPIFEENLRSIPSVFPNSIKTFLKKLIKDKEFSAKKGEKVQTYLDDKKLPKKLLILGMGSAKKLSSKSARILGGKIGKTIKKLKVQNLHLLTPNELTSNLQEFLEGLLLVQYQNDKHKNKKKNAKQLEGISIILTKKPKNMNTKIEHTKLLVDAIYYVKDLINCPANMINSEYLAKETRKIAKDNKYKVAILGKKELTKMGWGGVLAVNQGSSNDPKCLVLQYDGAKKKDPSLAIVGKAITFDTGGYNLKPTSSIETMHQDMAGGAAILGLFKLLNKLNVRQNVIGIIPVAENMISKKAYRPSDIITMLSKHTVEITNTDAEGRLILADGITYAKKLKADTIITIATLTSAVAIALGNRYAGLMSNDLSLRNKLQKAGRETDDLGWPLPIHKDYKKALNSEVADLKNLDLKSGRYAGASKAAAFLQNFVGKTKWCHIDIGGEAFIDDPKEYQTKGATAHGLQMLLKFLENES